MLGLIVNRISQGQPLSPCPAECRGFSLIELLVSMAIFIMVITMAVGALMVLVDSNAKAQNMESAMTNLSFAIDSISREVRTGRGFYCDTSSISASLATDQTRDCSGGTNLSLVEGGISLTGGGNPRITYRFNSSAGSIDRRVGNGAWLPLTSDDVTITSLSFLVINTDVADNIQPTVTIFIEGNAGELYEVDTGFSMQASVSKHVIDL